MDERVVRPVWGELGPGAAARVALRSERVRLAEVLGGGRERGAVVGAWAAASVASAGSASSGGGSSKPKEMSATSCILGKVS